MLLSSTNSWKSPFSFGRLIQNLDGRGFAMSISIQAWAKDNTLRSFVLLLMPRNKEKVNVIALIEPSSKSSIVRLGNLTHLVIVVFSFFVLYSDDQRNKRKYLLSIRLIGQARAVLTSLPESVIATIRLSSHIRLLVVR